MVTVTLEEARGLFVPGAKATLTSKLWLTNCGNLYIADGDMTAHGWVLLGEGGLSVTLPKGFAIPDDFKLEGVSGDMIDADIKGAGE